MFSRKLLARTTSGCPGREVNTRWSSPLPSPPPTQEYLDKLACIRQAYEGSSLSVNEIALRFGYAGAGVISSLAKKHGWKIRGNKKRQFKLTPATTRSGKDFRSLKGLQAKKGPPMLPQLDEGKMRQRFHAPQPLASGSCAVEELAPRTLNDRLTALHIALDLELGACPGEWQADRWKPGKRKEPEL